MQKSEKIIDKIKKIHGNRYQYNFDNFNWKQISLLKINCKKHGWFRQELHSHLKGYNCPKCANKSKNSKSRWNTERFIEEANNIHKEKYDYSKVNYYNSRTLITIVCKKHGEFVQKPNQHLNGHGCRECGKNIGKPSSKRLTQEQFLQNSLKIHGDTYDYSLAKYFTAHKHVTLICKKHGKFEITPSNHFANKGCAKCNRNSSFAENEIKDFIKTLNVEIIENDRKIIPPFELDIFVPSRNLAIEYCGLYWHNSEKVGNHYHYNKYNLCKDKGIRLLTIFESDWIHRRNAVLNLIKISLSNTQITIDRENIQEINENTAKSFLNEYHIKSYVKANKHYGIYYDELFFMQIFIPTWPASLRRAFYSILADYDLRQLF